MAASRVSGHCLVAPADLLLTYMNADTPRLSTNSAGAGHLNSVHGVYLRDPVRELGRESLPLASLTSMTLVGAETVGRAYGGGMLKVEPKEADRLPVASPALIEAARDQLEAIRPAVAELLGRGALLEAVTLVDDVLLVGQLGLSPAEVKELREAYVELSGRRAARGTSMRGR